MGFFEKYIPIQIVISLLSKGGFDINTFVGAKLRFMEYEEAENTFDANNFSLYFGTMF